ncbi:hypothetical protein JCM11491_001451 [Sporobolomyces phaffii]
MSGARPTPTVLLPTAGPSTRRAAWVGRDEDSVFSSSPAPRPSPAPFQPILNDPAIVELRRASIAQLNKRTSTTSSAPAPAVGSQALVTELAKFDPQTPYEELRYVMELTAAQASEGIYPISSSSTVSSPSSAKSYSELSFISEMDSTLPTAEDAMDPKLSPAARRYLDEYNSGHHRLPPTMGFSTCSSPPPHPRFPFYPLPGSPPPPLSLGTAFPPYTYSPEPALPPAPSTFPFIPAQPVPPATSYFPGPITAPIPNFDFHLDSAPPSSYLPQFTSPGDTLSPSFSNASSSPSSSFYSPPGFGYQTPSTTPSVSPNPDSFAFFKAPPFPVHGGEGGQSDAEAIVGDPPRRKKKSLVRLCAEEHARTRGAVKSWGIVKFFDGNKGWGFILDQSRVPGEDVWTHYTNLEIPRGHRFLVSEEVVEYLIVWDTKKSQLKALLVTGLGGTPLLAFSDPILAASLSKFKPSQGPLPPTLPLETKRKIYAIKRDKQKREDEEKEREIKDKMRSYLEKEQARDHEDDLDLLQVQRGLLNFGILGGTGSAKGQEGGEVSATVGLGLIGIEEVDEDDDDGTEGGHEDVRHNDNDNDRGKQA